MDGPLDSSVDNFCGRNSKETAAKSEHDEESGWTQYLEDFSTDQRKNGGFSDDDDDSFTSPSLVSDAASPNYKQVHDQAAGHHHFPKRLNVKKHKTKKYSCSLDLEDTASSPVSSPKGKDCDDMEHEMDEGNSKKNNKNTKSGSVELKKRGLCLMPFSMFLNSLG